MGYKPPDINEILVRRFHMSGSGELYYHFFGTCKHGRYIEAYYTDIDERTLGDIAKDFFDLWERHENDEEAVHDD